MADKIAVMNGGRIEQLGTPSELYEKPRTAFVAGFLGVSNLLRGTVAGSTRSARRWRRGERRRRRRSTAGAGEVAVGIRPEKIQLGGARTRTVRRAGRRGAPTLASPRSTSSRPPAGAADRVRAEHRRPERRRSRRASASSSHFVPGGHVCPRWRPRRNSNDRVRLTRPDLLRRAAVGGAALAFPGALAGLGGEAEPRRRRPSKRTCARRSCFSNWPLYIDVDGKASSTRRSTSSRRSTASRSSTSRTSTTTPRSSGRSRRRSRSGQSSAATSS